MKEEVERIKRLVGIDHNRWEQPCTCDKCKNMCKVPVFEDSNCRLIKL